MRWLERIERHFNWLAFPGLFKYLTFLGVIVFVAQWARPDIADILDFSRTEIMRGQIWRIVSFIFTPVGVMEFSGVSMLFMFFSMMISIMISDALEALWGATRLTLYILTSWVALVISQFIFGIDGAKSGMFLYTSMFFAFATFFPKVEFRLFFFIPVQVRFLAWLLFAVLLLGVFAQPALLVIVVPALLPYGLWVLPEVIRGRAALAGAAVRRGKFNRDQMPQNEAFHRCETCGRTEKTDPTLNFFTLPDGKEYCAEHLPEEYATKR